MEKGGLTIIKKKRTLFHNANILTLDPSFSVGKKMLVEGDKVVGIGNDSDFNVDYDCKVDLEGRTVIPGFNDSHLHLAAIGEAIETVDLTDVTSIKGLQKKLESYLKKRKLAPGTWIKGRGWDQDRFLKKKFPDRKVIDAVVTEYPVLLKRNCLHIAVANSKALEIAGITKSTEAPPGGEIDRDKGGVPTGVLRDNAMALVEREIPEPEEGNYLRWIKKGSKELVKVGITSVQTDDFGNLNRFRNGYRAYQKLKANDKLPLRVNLQVRMGKLTDFKTFVEDTGLKTGSGDKWLRIGPCKILADGSMGARTAALNSPYCDCPETEGILIYESEELQEFARFANNAGFQLAIHAIGDRAIEEIIDIYQGILSENDNRKTGDAGEKSEDETSRMKKVGGKLRPRIIHAQLTNNNLLARAEKLGIAFDIQPIFLNSDLHVAEDRVGPERLEGAYAWKTMYQRGIPLGGSSDGPVDSYKPLDGVYSAVTRKDLKGYPEGGWLSDEALGVREALKIYTLGSAFNSFEENIKGTLTTGKLADFVVLSNDPTSVYPDDINNIEVIATYVGGKKVY